MVWPCNQRARRVRAFGCSCHEISTICKSAPGRERRWRLQHYLRVRRDRAHGRSYKKMRFTKMNKFSLLSANPLLLRRATYVAVIVFCIAATLMLISASDRATTRARDVAIQSSWQANAAPLLAQTSPEAVYSRFSMKAAAANADLTWQANSANELRASLRALDAAQINVVQVKITRSGTNFLVNAERAP